MGRLYFSRRRRWCSGNLTVLTDNGLTMMRQNERDTCLQGSSFNKKLHHGIKFFHTCNQISSSVQIDMSGGKRQNSKKRKISKINLRLFLFNLAGTFRGWLQTMLRAEQQQKKNPAPCIFLSIFNQCSIMSTVGSRGNCFTRHCSLFSRIEFRTIEFTISPDIFDECVRGKLHTFDGNSLPSNAILSDVTSHFIPVRLNQMNTERRKPTCNALTLEYQILIKDEEM